MAEDTHRSGGDQDPRSRNLLDPFLELLERFIATYTESARRALGENDSGEIMDAAGEALRHQVSELGAFLREGVPRMSAQATRDMNQVLRMQGGDILLRGGTQALLGPLSPEKLLGLDEIFHEIKKILRTLLDIIWKNKPPWYEEFWLLLDQIFRLIMSLLFPMLKTPLHRSEVQYLREMYELGRLQRLHQRANGNGDDEDDA